jgi:uncharacterized protein (DUF1919 family)
MVHHKYQYLHLEKGSIKKEEHSFEIYIYNHDHILILDHMVYYMDHDYMVQNINEYIEDVYICKHMPKQMSAI